jgi:hypothetical protein
MFRFLAIVTLCISSCALTGCIESNFQLASEGRLPKWMALPPGLTRKDVSVTLNLYTPLRGPDAKFILKDRKGKHLAEVKAKWNGGSVVVNGITETITLVPYRAHENMEQNGRAVALFYVTDDAAAWKEIWAGGRSNK